jgi:hypothetical protein
MPEKINEYYSVKYRPYDIEGDGASVLEQACRTFFSSGSASGHVRKIENGQEVHIRYKLSPKRFRWKKTCKGVTLQEAFSISGGRFCMVSHDMAGICFLPRNLTAAFTGSGRRTMTATPKVHGCPAALCGRYSLSEKRRNGGTVACSVSVGTGNGGTELCQ